MIRMLALLLLPFSTLINDAATAKKVVKLMGCHFEITAVADNDSLAWHAVETAITEISRIEKIISSWDTHSQTSAINEAAGKHPVKVGKELYDLIYRAQKVSQLTGGAFDISFASMEKIWDFNGQEQVLPDSQLVKEAARLINWQHIILNPDDTTVFLRDEGMRIGFGAIGKGYAANRARALMQNIKGVRGGVVNASGDLIAWGDNGKETPWTVQIADPKNKNRSIAWLNLNDMAIVTSGDYEKFFVANGLRFAHIINPRTGYPTTGVKSVTVICPDTELADALATSIFVMGYEEGMRMVNELNQIECIIITDDNQIHTSSHLQLNYY